MAGGGALAGYDPDSGLYLCRQGGSLRALPAATDGVLALGASHSTRGGLVDGMPAARVDEGAAPLLVADKPTSSEIYVVFSGWIASPVCAIDQIPVQPVSLPGARRWFVRVSVLTSDFSFRINFEDSENCGGTNGFTQTAWAFFAVGLTQGSQVALTAVGRTELQASGFESFEIFRLAGIAAEVQTEMQAGSWAEVGVGPRIVKRASLGEGLGCQMRSQTESLVFDALPRTPEDDGFFVRVSTVDGAYHVDAFWELAFTIR